MNKVSAFGPISISVNASMTVFWALRLCGKMAFVVSHILQGSSWLEMVIYSIDSESQYSASSSGDSEDADSISLSDSGDDEGNSTEDLTDKGNRNAAAISEIEALARNDTQLLRAWRIAVLLIIAGTFVAVTTGTCVFIKKQQEINSNDSVSTFVRGSYYDLEVFLTLPF
jgi:hypothetical protein